MICNDGSVDDNTQYRHSMLKVTLRNGEQYALDITGEQYGHHDPIIPWDRYSQTRLEHIEGIRHFGFHRLSRKYLQKPKWNRVGIKSLNEEVAEVINATTKTWQTQNISLRDMLNLPQDAFVRRRAELFSFLDLHLEAKKAFLDEAGMRQLRFEQSDKEAGNEGGRCNVHAVKGSKGQS